MHMLKPPEKKQLALQLNQLQSMLTGDRHTHITELQSPVRLKQQQ